MMQSVLMPLLLVLLGTATAHVLNAASAPAAGASRFVSAVMLGSRGSVTSGMYGAALTQTQMPVAARMIRMQEGSGEEKAEAPLTPTEAKEAAGDEYKTPKMEEAEAEARVEESKEELIDMGMEEVDAEEGAIAKEALKAEVSQGLLGPRPDKAVVGEILLALEARNPTRSPATSPLLNGRYKIVYASGASPGLKAVQLLLKASQSAPKSPSGADLLDVDEVFVTFRPSQPRVEATVRTRFLSFDNTLKLTSKVEAESAVRLVETYDSAESESLSIRLPFQSPVQYKRSLLVSYLDEELLVVRDALGRPDVLMRVDDVQTGPTTVVDEEIIEDPLYDSAPGAS
mmetsp:Transcript_16673/g.35391  ORF Transcript_16673/g.35391 Transcript_16673/m.35391 type:complete len:343 (-) Transcript_16673:420-1448(-)